MNLCNGFNEDNFKCFIFSDDVNQIEKILNNDKISVECKIIELNTKIRDVRKVLLKEYNVDISRIDLLDNSKIFILAKNYKKIKNIPEQKMISDIDVIDNLKKDLVVMAMSTITKLSVEIPNMQNKNNAKFRNKSKQLLMLKQVLSKDFANIL